MKLTSFLKAVFKSSKFALILGSLIGIIVGSIIFRHTQDYRIYRFQTDFVESNKSQKEIYNEGMHVVTNASSPSECLATIDAIWLTMIKEANKESNITHLEVIQASNDFIHKYCK